MKFASAVLLPLLSIGASLVSAKSWGFEDATLTITGKGAGVGGGFKEKLSAQAPLSQQVTLGHQDTLKVILTTTEGGSPTRPHQAFLSLKDSKSGLEESFPLSVKDSGKGKVEVTQKDLPFQLLTTTKPLEAKLVIASFGTSTALYKKVFDLVVVRDPSAALNVPEAPLRYGPLSEIHHIFRDDPKSPPKIISTFFLLAIGATFPALLIVWATLGANVKQIGTAMSRAPAAHALFVGSIFALEGIFAMYYLSWTLFQVLPAAGLLGVVAFVSGSRALSEVQERRVAGKR